MNPPAVALALALAFCGSLMLVVAAVIVVVRLVARLAERLFLQLCGYCVCEFWTLTPWRTYYCPHPNCQLASLDVLAADLNQGDTSWT